MIKAVKISETLDNFLENHPELTVVRNGMGKVVNICFPEEATQTSYTVVGDDVRIYYTYENKSIRFPEW